MALEALLAGLHLAAVLALVVFSTSQAALLRPAWFNAEVVARLVVVNRIHAVCLLALLLTGAARMAWGVKGWDWYASQPLLWAKGLLWLALVWAAVPPARAYARWAALPGGSLPDAGEIGRVRRVVMRAAHAMLLIPLLAVALARGLFTV